MDQNTSSYNFYNYLDHLKFSEPKPTYEQAVDEALRQMAIGETRDMTPQQAGDILYDYYASVGPAPANTYYGPTTKEATTTNQTTSYGSTVYNGKSYNLDDPTQRDAYLAVRNSDYEKAMNEANADVDYNANRDIDSTTQTYQDKLNEFNKFLNQYNTNSDEYAKGLADLYEGYGQGNVRRQNYFTRLSPDTYQSGQGSSFDYATKKYQQGYGETNSARNEWKGGLDTGRERLGTDYNNWMTDYQRNVANQKQGNVDLYNQNRDSLMNKAIGWGRSAAKSQFTPTGAVTPQNVDMSSYTPYINFQGLQSSAGANQFKKFLPTQGQSPLAETLGYQLPTKEKDPLNSYLY